MVERVFGWIRRALPSLALAGLLLTAAPPDARAANAMPDFLLPVPCGTTWTLSTYDTFNGISHREAVDLNMVGVADDRGQRVLASAGGRVTKVVVSGGQVDIDNGGGWTTRYLHMMNITVSAGQVVIPGERIGYVSDVGQAVGSHLHYEMYRDGVMVRPVFDGETVQWNRVSGDRQATHTFQSTNCLAGRNWAPEFAGKMIRHPGGTIDFVAANGYRYWVSNMSIVACLGGSAINVSDAVFNSIARNQQGDPGGRWADCNTKFVNRLIHHPNGTVDYVDATGTRNYVPSDAVVACLGGWTSIINLDSATFDSMPRNSYGTYADCYTKLVGRVIRHPGGTIDFVNARRLRYYIPSMSIVECLGPASTVIEVSSAKFTSLPRNAAGVYADCNTELRNRLIRRQDGTVDYVTTGGLRYWVPNSSTVGCLGGWATVIGLPDGRFNAIPRNSKNTWASCSTRSL